MTNMLVIIFLPFILQFYVIFHKTWQEDQVWLYFYMYVIRLQKLTTTFLQTLCV